MHTILASVQMLNWQHAGGRGRLLADTKIQDMQGKKFSLEATWTNQNIWSLCLGLRNHNLENADDLFLKSSLMLQALLRRVDYNGPGSCNPVFLLYTFANTANTLRLAWPGMHHTISILWTPASCHYHNIASWVDQSQTGQARSLQAQSLATLLQGGTRQLLPTDGKIEDDHCFLTNIVLLIQQTLHLLHPIRPDEGWTF